MKFPSIGTLELFAPALHSQMIRQSGNIRKPDTRRSNQLRGNSGSHYSESPLCYLLSPSNMRALRCIRSLRQRHSIESQRERACRYCRPLVVDRRWDNSGLLLTHFLKLRRSHNEAEKKSHYATTPIPATTISFSNADLHTRSTLSPQLPGISPQILDVRLMSSQNLANNRARWIVHIKSSRAWPMKYEIRLYRIWWMPNSKYVR